MTFFIIIPCAMASDFNLIRLDTQESEKIYKCFLQGFLDYNLKIKPSFDDFMLFLRRNGYDDHLSFGVTYERMLVGIILNCPLISGIYSCSLSVIPKYRKGGIGKTLIGKTLSVSKPLILECLEENKSSLSFYEKLGFEKVRCLKLYSGNVAPLSLNADEITLSSISDNYRPSHQNTLEALEKIEVRAFSYHSAKIVFSSSGEIHLLSCPDIEDGARLLSFASFVTGRPLSAINIDEREKDAIIAFEKVGMKAIGSQFELIKR